MHLPSAFPSRKRYLRVCGSCSGVSARATWPRLWPVGRGRLASSSKAKQVRLGDAPIRRSHPLRDRHHLRQAGVTSPLVPPWCPDWSLGLPTAGPDLRLGTSHRCVCRVVPDSLYQRPKEEVTHESVEAFERVLTEDPNSSSYPVGGCTPPSTGRGEGQRTARE